MTADDVKYSLDRVINPKTQSPGAGFFSSIKGYDDVAAGKADEPRRHHRRRPLHGQVRTDPARRHLPACHGDQFRASSCRRRRSRSTAPISASIRSAPAPSSSPNGRSASASSSSATRTITRKGVPYLDKITFEIGQEPIVALLRLQKGEVDILGDGIPPAKFLEVMADPEQQGRWSSTAASSTPATSP